MRAAGGLMTARRPEELSRRSSATPVRGTYRGYDIVSMPPPSSGGVLLIADAQHAREATSSSANDPASLHLMIEAMKRAYADRAQFLGDPDAVKIAGRGPDLEALRRGAARTHRPDTRDAVDRHSSRQSAALEGDNTTHYSVVDRFGNAVVQHLHAELQLRRRPGRRRHRRAAQQRARRFRRQARRAERVRPGRADDANAPGPGKRPLSSMTPTIVLKDGKPVLRHRLARRQPHHHRGAAGDRQRASTTSMPSPTRCSAPRLHHQWLPDEVVVEPGMPTRSCSAGGARPQDRCRARCSPRPIRSWSRRTACGRRRRHAARAARWRRDTERYHTERYSRRIARSACRRCSYSPTRVIAALAICRGLPSPFRATSMTA